MWRDHKVVRFVAVGALAAIVHWSIAVGLIAWQQWAPWLANTGGWLVALTVSFSGHYHGTFRGSGAPYWRAAIRFASVSALAFAVNQIAYGLLIHRFPQFYALALAVVLVGVACGTWWLSRRWVFVSSPARR